MYLSVTKFVLEAREETNFLALQHFLKSLLEVHLLLFIALTGSRLHPCPNQDNMNSSVFSYCRCATSLSEELCRKSSSLLRSAGLFPCQVGLFPGLAGGRKLITEHRARKSQLIFFHLLIGSCTSACWYSNGH